MKSYDITELADFVERHDGSIATEPKSVQSIMCPHGFNRLAMQAFGQHCAYCPTDQLSGHTK